MTDGLFHVKYEGSSGLIGGWTLHLDLVVDRPNNKASGTATLTRAVPVDPTVTFPPVSGPIITMATMKDVHYGLRLESSRNFGRSISVNVVVGNDWKSGEANVDAFLDTPDGTIMFNARIEQVA
jgi:hypothetical protein